MSRHVVALASISVGLWALVLINSPERFFSTLIRFALMLV